MHVITTQDMKPQCVLLRFWHLNQYFEITNCVRKTHWEAHLILRRVSAECFRLRVRVNNVSVYQ